MPEMPSDTPADPKSKDKKKDEDVEELKNKIKAVKENNAILEPDYDESDISEVQDPLTIDR